MRDPGSRPVVYIAFSRLRSSSICMSARQPDDGVTTCCIANSKYPEHSPGALVSCHSIELPRPEWVVDPKWESNSRKNCNLTSEPRFCCAWAPLQPGHEPPLSESSCQ